MVIDPITKLTRCYCSVTVYMLFSFLGLFASGFWPEGISQANIISIVVWVVWLFYQVLWVGYGVYTLCQTGVGGAPLYSAPPFIGAGLYFTYILALAGYVGLWFAWDRGRLEIAVAMTGIVFVLLIVCCYLSIRGLRLHGDTLYRYGLDQHVRLTRGLVQNGVFMFTSWITVAVVFLISELLQLWGGASQEDAETIRLGILSAVFLIWIILDWCIFEHHLRYIFSPYIILLPMVIVLVVESFEAWDRNSIFEIVLIGVIALAFLIKLIMACSRISSLQDPVITSPLPAMSKSLSGSAVLVPSSVYGSASWPGAEHNVYSSIDRVPPVHTSRLVVDANSMPRAIQYRY